MPWGLRVPIWKVNLCSRFLRLSVVPWCRERPQIDMCSLEWLERLKCRATGFDVSLSSFSTSRRWPLRARSMWNMLSILCILGRTNKVLQLKKNKNSNNWNLSLALSPTSRPVKKLAGTRKRGGGNSSKRCFGTKPKWFRDSGHNFFRETRDNSGTLQKKSGHRRKFYFTFLLRLTSVSQKFGRMIQISGTT